MRQPPLSEEQDELISNPTSLRDLFSVGFLRPIDVFFALMAVVGLVTLVTVIAVGSDIQAMIVLGAVVVIINAWTTVLVFRSTWTILVLLREIRRLPPEAARLATRFMTGA